MPLVRLGEPLPATFARDRVSMATRVRSSFLLSSRALLRETGVFVRYVALLSPEDRAALEAVVPGWMSVALIRRHYAACDALGLSTPQMLDLGKGIYARMHKPVYAVAVRLAGAVGVTPWTLAEQGVRMWHRAFDGGDVLVEELGPKEARVELLGFPYADIPYCRVAWRGILLGATELFSRRAYVNERARSSGPHQVTYRISWA